MRSAPCTGCGKSFSTSDWYVYGYRKSGAPFYKGKCKDCHNVKKMLNRRARGVGPRLPKKPTVTKSREDRYQGIQSEWRPLLKKIINSGWSTTKRDDWHVKLDNIISGHRQRIVNEATRVKRPISWTWDKRIKASLNVSAAWRSGRTKWRIKLDGLARNWRRKDNRKVSVQAAREAEVSVRTDG